ncbi:MAG: CcdB family protein [Deltaproteobacteria bacterium]
MPQFDVLRNPRGGAYPFVVDLQCDSLARFATRIVAPMIAAKRYGRKPITRLNPIARVNRADYVVVVQDLASIPITELGELVTSLRAHRSELIAALDLMFTGV